ncbi:MAG: hypothetical protein Q9187_000977 [Circinaria calcarea]
MPSVDAVATPITGISAARSELQARMSTSPYLPLPHQQHQFAQFPPNKSSIFPISSATGNTSADRDLAFPNDLSNDGPLSIHGDEHPIGATNGADGKARLRKACDSCSIRKVKVGFGLGTGARRRGPPNRHAEAIKKRRFESPATPGHSIPSSPTHAAHAAQTLASFAQHHVLSAESICPFPVLQLLVDDYFLFIHPLIPVPHEPSFRDGLHRREDVNNPRFLALLASMIGCLVASFPRKPRLHLKAQNKENLFPNSMSLIERCRKVAVEARGPGYLDRDLDVYDTATSYLLALSSAYTFNWPRCRLYMGECLTMLTVIGLHKTSSNPSTSLRNSLSPSSGDESVSGYNMDIIRQEMMKRIFWVIFVSIRSIHQLGASFRELWIYPDSPSKPYPDLPIEVDDAYIFPNHVLPQPKGILSELVGFNVNVRVYNTYNDLYKMDIAYGLDELYDWHHQRRTFDRCLQAAKQVLGDVPTELVLNPSMGFNQFEQSRDFLGPVAPSYPEASDPGPYPYVKTEDTSANRRALQCEIQKANINGSQLATRCYIVEKYWNLYDKHRCIRSGNDTTNDSGNATTNTSPIIAGASYSPTPASHIDLTEQEMASERETVIKDLLMMLGNISQVSMEPNGGSFIHKIRQIASTLLDVPRTRKGQLALRAEEYLAAFVEVLMKLEHVSFQARGREGEDGTDGDEEAELRIWADLREYQERFARSGGFLAED